MNTKRLLTIGTPLAAAAAILFFWPKQRGGDGPVAIPAAEAPPRSLSADQLEFDAAAARPALGHERGSADAPVVVLELSDFGCKYCGRFARESYPQLVSEFVSTGKVRWKYVPFVLGMFPNGSEAARSAECAAQQDTTAFWGMHDKLFNTQSEWKAAGNPAMLFLKYADEIGADARAFAACYSDDAAADRTQEANRLADRLGVRVTPTFFVNGVRVEGALPVAEFRRLIEAAAQAAR